MLDLLYDGGIEPFHGGRGRNAFLTAIKALRHAAFNNRPESAPAACFAQQKQGANLLPAIADNRPSQACLSGILFICGQMRFAVNTR
ncbi:MAG: hypothetical protein KH230_17020 [Enterocloster asparagiformis]|nr:hypothetical protein [Enterocloster asparagiformis]